MKASKAVAADVLRAAFGPIGEHADRRCIVARGGADLDQRDDDRRRAHQRSPLGRDWPLLALHGPLEHGSAARPSSRCWRRALASALLVGAVAAVEQGGFNAMVEFTAPVFWLFFLLAGVSARRAALPRSARARGRFKRAAVSGAAAAVLRRLRLHAVVQPVVRAQPGTGRLQRGVDRRRGARRRRRRAGRAAPGRRHRRPATGHPQPRDRDVPLQEEPVMHLLPTPLIARRRVLAASLLLPCLARAQGGKPPLDVHYVPTPQPVVDRMLELAGVREGEMLYDLGCGDGRIVVTAAKRYGARGVGIDLDPQRIAEARANAEREGVRNVEFRVGDLFEADLSDADVVTLYLLSSINRRLRPRLWRQLRVGSRVVSHAFDMGSEWPPEHTEHVSGATIHTWTVTQQHKDAA
ncbi:MAG: methyltransferase domain-containing protein [Comamonadaceae bacterium]|nr:methyltransferase domain-containing protein [Comamonadaceae bacterium]